MTTYRYSTERHAMVPVSETNDWPFPRLPPSVGAKPKRRWGVIVRHTLIYLGAAAGVAVLLAACTSSPVQPAPTTTASSSGITFPARKRAPVTPEKRVERVVEKTASSASGMAGGAASRAVRVTGHPMVDSLLSGAVRNTVSELRGWWKEK